MGPQKYQYLHMATGTNLFFTLVELSNTVVYIRVDEGTVPLVEAVDNNRLVTVVVIKPHLRPTRDMPIGTESAKALQSL